VACNILCGEAGSSSRTLRLADNACSSLLCRRIVLPHVLLVWGVTILYALARVDDSCDITALGDSVPEENTVAKSPSKPIRKSVRDEKSEFGKDRRRRHHHYLVTVNYADGETFGRVYTDKEKATRFAERQRRSPIVKSARVTQVS